MFNYIVLFLLSHVTCLVSFRDDILIEVLKVKSKWRIANCMGWKQNKLYVTT